MLGDQSKSKVELSIWKKCLSDLPDFQGENFWRDQYQYLMELCAWEHL